jgi:hypothetical protein
MSPVMVYTHTTTGAPEGIAGVTVVRKFSAIWHPTDMPGPQTDTVETIGVPVIIAEVKVVVVIDAEQGSLGWQEENAVKVRGAGKDTTTVGNAHAKPRI